MNEARKLAAILVADIVGYSRLTFSDEERTLARLRSLRSDLVDPTVALHRGRIVKRTGDGGIVEFHSAVDAVRCAIEVQAGMVERNAGVPPERRIEFRIGIHIGDVVEESDGDLMGDGVNVAARLEGIAEPNGICVSEDVYRQVKSRLELRVSDLGPQTLKNIAEPVRTYRVHLDGTPAPPSAPSRRAYRRMGWAAAGALILALAAVTWLSLSHRTGSGLAGKSSLAVLPFANLAGDEATGRLADGLTEDIITDLSRYRTMDVIARNSTATYRGKAVDVRQVGKELNARYVLEGSVQREGDQIRVTAQLIDTTSDAHLWSERWDRPSKDFFAVQSEIADQLGSCLGGGGVIDKAEQETAKRSRPNNFTAYELYLAGHSEHLRMNREGNKNAIDLLEKAVAADPRLARAWAELASARQVSMLFGADPGPIMAISLAEARRAVEIDPRDAMAHAQLGYVLGVNGDIALSEGEFETALRLNSGDAEVLALYAGWAAAFGQPERGLEATDRAIRLNPNYQAWQAWNFSYAYFFVGRYEDALRILDRLPKENYNYWSWIMRAASYAALGRSVEAKAAVSDALAQFPNLTVESFVAELTGADRPRFLEPMRAAGFPVCTKPAALSKKPDLARLPECLQK